jgi:pyridoxine kinase
VNILSIQSHVVAGHVGNSAAVFPIQRLGHEVWPLHTLQFSNHPGFGTWKGRVFDAAMIDDCVEGLAGLDRLRTCDGVLSGYTGSVDIAEAILRAAARVKSANRQALYCCDPVIGDVGGLYVRPELADFMARQAAPAADIMTPNLFELEYLVSRRIGSRVDFIAALAALHGLGPRVVLVTSVLLDDTPAGMIDTIVSDAAGCFRLRTPRFDFDAKGAGDVMAALFFARLLAGDSAAAALGKSSSSLFGVLQRTVEAGSPDLLTIAAQDEFVTPSRVFTPEPF